MEKKLTRREIAPVVDLRSVPACLNVLLEGGDTVVLTNGCFDLLHHGHVALLEACANLGDVLVVGINDDEGVKALKGRGHPILSTRERGVILAGLRWVDLVVSFSELTARRLIQTVRPDVYAKGDEYHPEFGSETLSELALLEQTGTTIKFIPCTSGASSSDMYERASLAVVRDPGD